MNRKQNLVLYFVLDCSFVGLLGLTMIAHVGFFAVSCLVCLYLIYSKAFPTKKPASKKYQRELKPIEIIAWFLISVAAICIFGFAETKGLLHNAALLIPMGIIFLALRLLDFSKDLAALQASESASN